MPNKENPIRISHSIKLLWELTPVKQRAIFYKLSVLIVFAAIAEILSIIAVIPFVQVLTNSPELQSSESINNILKFFNITDMADIQVFFVVSFIFIVIIASLMRLLLLRYSAYASFSAGSIFSVNLYRNTLMLPYKTHIESNTSDDINSITAKNNTVIYGVVSPLCNLLSAFVIALTIIAGLIYVDPMTSLFIFTAFSSLYLLIGFYSKSRLNNNSKIIAKESTHVIQTLQEGLGSIRDVIIENAYESFIRVYKQADVPLRQAQASSVVISQSPRFILEGLGMTVIACVALYFIIFKPGDSLLTTLTVFALGSQRLLPILQQAYMSWSNIIGSSQSLSDVVSRLYEPDTQTNELQVDSSKPLEIIFNKSLELDSLSFSYAPSENKVFNNISFKISRGDKVGFIGESGCGKSTALDIIMGLLDPTKGEVLIDGYTLSRKNKKQWHSLIAHVPQRIFIADSSIKSNIAFGIEEDKINNVKLWEAITVAELESVVNKLSEKEHTILGENGAKLSGGQIQRIGIARAIYKNAPVLILDEATSALDSETENKVIDNIMQLPDTRTLIMVAHRLNTLLSCDYCLKFEHGDVSYSDAPKIS